VGAIRRGCEGPGGCPVQAARLHLAAAVAAVGGACGGRNGEQHPPDDRARSDTTSGSTRISVFDGGTSGKGVRGAPPRGSVGAAGGHDTHAGRRRAAAEVVSANRPTAPAVSSAVHTAHTLWSTNPPVSVSLASEGWPRPEQRSGSGAGLSHQCRHWSSCRRRVGKTGVA